jgi:hypothetical protein
MPAGCARASGLGLRSTSLPFSEAGDSPLRSTFHRRLTSSTVTTASWAFNTPIRIAFAATAWSTRTFVLTPRPSSGGASMEA